MKTILAVDDSAPNLTLVRMTLNDHYKINVVTSGEQAVRYIEKKTPDLILMDVCMPGMDGIEAVKKIREITGDSCRVIFLTALADAQLNEQLKEVESDGTVAKPFSPEELLSAVKSVIGE